MWLWPVICLGVAQTGMAIVEWRNTAHSPPTRRNFAESAVIMQAFVLKVDSQKLYKEVDPLALGASQYVC